MSFHRPYFEQKKKLEYYHNFSIVNFHRCKIEVLLIHNHRCGCTWCALCSDIKNLTLVYARFNESNKIGIPGLSQNSV